MVTEHVMFLFYPIQFCSYFTTVQRKTFTMSLEQPIIKFQMMQFSVTTAEHFEFLVVWAKSIFCGNTAGKFYDGNRKRA